jgi:hypothetical protein
VTSFALYGSTERRGSGPATAISGPLEGKREGSRLEYGAGSYLEYLELPGLSVEEERRLERGALVADVIPVEREERQMRGAEQCAARAREARAAFKRDQRERQRRERERERIRRRVKLPSRQWQRRNAVEYLLRRLGPRIQIGYPKREPWSSMPELEGIYYPAERASRLFAGAEAVGISPRTLKTAKAALSDAGLLVTERRGWGPGSTISWRLRPP